MYIQWSPLIIITVNVINRLLLSKSVSTDWMYPYIWKWCQFSFSVISRFMLSVLSSTKVVTLSDDHCAYVGSSVYWETYENIFRYEKKKTCEMCGKEDKYDLLWKWTNDAFSLVRTITVGFLFYVLKFIIVYGMELFLRIPTGNDCAYVGTGIRAKKGFRHAIRAHASTETCMRRYCWPSYYTVIAGILCPVLNPRRPACARTWPADTRTTVREPFERTGRPKPKAYNATYRAIEMGSLQTRQRCATPVRLRGEARKTTTREYPLSANRTWQQTRGAKSSRTSPGHFIPADSPTLLRAFTHRRGVRTRSPPTRARRRARFRRPLTVHVDRRRCGTRVRDGAHRYYDIRSSRSKTMSRRQRVAGRPPLLATRATGSPPPSAHVRLVPRTT